MHKLVLKHNHNAIFILSKHVNYFLGLSARYIIFIFGVYLSSQLTGNYSDITRVLYLGLV